MGDEELYGRFLADELISAKPAKFLLRPEMKSPRSCWSSWASWDTPKLARWRSTPNRGPFIRNTLVADKSSDKLSALQEIYRVMRPGEPPTPETAETAEGLFFDSERYDLSAVGRGNEYSLDQECPDDIRVLRKEDIVALSKRWSICAMAGAILTILTILATGACSVGELMENQYRVGLLRMERD